MAGEDHLVASSTDYADVEGTTRVNINHLVSDEMMKTSVILDIVPYLREEELAGIARIPDIVSTTETQVPLPIQPLSTEDPAKLAVISEVETKRVIKVAYASIAIDIACMFSIIPASLSGQIRRDHIDVLKACIDMFLLSFILAVALIVKFARPPYGSGIVKAISYVSLGSLVVPVLVLCYTFLYLALVIVVVPSVLFLLLVAVVYSYTTWG